MGGYHDIVMPNTFSLGSQFTVGYDTRITTLENGIETRMSKYAPQGRRRYSVLKGIAAATDILALYEFYMLRQGALNSFKFRDWMDYATNPTRETFSPEGQTNPVTAFDSVLSPITGRTYQMVSIYQDSARTLTRPILKVQPNTEKIAVNGVEIVSPNYTINYESVQVDIAAAVGEINSVTGGCQFIVPVRFAESTHEAISVAMQATDDTQSLPGFDLVEDIDPLGVSQDYQYGGSHFYTNVTGNVRLLEVQGRLQSLQTASANAGAILPQSFNIPAGGPIFVIHNASTSSDSLPILDNSLSVRATILVGATAEIYLSSPFGSDEWVIVQ